MKHVWINKQDNKECILFFNGWGMDENAVKHLTYENYDVCVFYQYQEPGSSFPDVAEYEKIYAVAWSLGVWSMAYNLLSSNCKPSKSIAINGTLKPIDNNSGLLEDVFDSTLENWDAKNRKKFMTRMFGGILKYSQNSDKFSVRETIEQKEELAYLKEKIKEQPEIELHIDTAVICKDDLIFNRKNQQRFWTNKCRTYEMTEPHYPFDAFETWKEIIEL